MNYQALTSGEKARLVMTILDSVEPFTDFDDFQESIGLMCEDIPGLESISEDSFLALVADCWEIFQQSLLP